VMVGDQHVDAERSRRGDTFDARNAVVDGNADETRFYFAHSYYPVPAQPELTVATADYPTAFTCAIARANIFAVQFHPEKSHLAGLQLLTNFVTWDGRA